MSAISGGVTAAGVAAAAGAASAGLSVAGAAGAFGSSRSSPGAGEPGGPARYIPPTVTVKDANAQNKKILASINKAIKKNNRYQQLLELDRHAQVREDISWFRDQRESAVALADPYVKERGTYISKMRQLMEDPESFLQKSPEYRARMAGGLEALTSQLAAKGLIGSGNVAIEAQALGAREASGQLDKDYARLAKLSGLDDANLAAAADIQAGARIPTAQEYNPRFEQQQFAPAQFEQGQWGGQAPAQPVQPTGYDYLHQGLEDLAPLLAMYGGNADLARLHQMQSGRRGTYTNDQGFIVQY